MMLWWGDWPWNVGHWIGVGFTTVFWVAIIVLVVYLLRRRDQRSGAQGPQALPPTGQPGQQVPGQAGGPSGPPQSPGAPNQEALRILEERYAKGEIDREEFLQRKSDLGG